MVGNRIHIGNIDIKNNELIFCRFINPIVTVVLRELRTNIIGDIKPIYG